MEVMPVLSLLILLLQAATPPQAVPAPREARLRPFLAEDALYSIPGAAWQMQRVGDMNGDGLDDLVVQRGGVFWGRGRLPRNRSVGPEPAGRWTSSTNWGHPEAPARIEAVSSVDGSLIRTLWSSEEREVVNWDMGGDLDGDSISDLVIGRAGLAVAISGASGNVVREVTAPTDNPFPRSIAFVGDVDGDGRDDYAVGAPGGMDQAGSVTLYGGRDGASRWSLEGVAGMGFGLCLSAVGDIDGDGQPDLAIASDPYLDQPLLAVSCRDGSETGRLGDRGGPFGPAGDIDGDGSAELFLGSLYEDSTDISGSVEVLSPGRDTVHFELLFPDHPFPSDYSRVIPLGDVDGDEVPDFLLGNARFHVGGEGPDSPPSHAGVPAPDLRAMSIEESVAIDSDPWCAFTWHSGTAWVRSGRTQEVIMTVWGPPGSRQGMGLAGCSVPDLDGDGWPEIAVVDMDGAYVFPGPGVPVEKK